MPQNKNVEAEPIYRMNYTILAERQFGDTFGERPLISRDTDVRGGIYYGTYGGEAIVVDPEKYPDAYNRLYGMAAEKAKTDGVIDRSKVLKAVFDTVHSEMQYSQKGVDQILQKTAEKNGRSKFVDGDKLELGSFINNGVGVCRHQALAIAATLERFKDQGYIRGDISVDRNVRWKEGNGKTDGHAWVRYTSSDGKVMILDVAQGYFGLLKDIDKKKNWNYMRPTDTLAREVYNLGRRGLSGLIEPQSPATLQDVPRDGTEVAA